MSDLSKLILKQILDNDRYCRAALPYLKSDYFEGEYRTIFRLLIKYFTEYHKRPGKPTFEYEFANSEYNVEANRGCFELIDQIYEIDEEERKVDYEWLLKTTEAWCKDKALHNAILKSIHIIDGKAEKLDRGAIPDILNKALSISFDQNIGHDYIENAKERWEYYHREENKIAFDLEMLNKITKGGVSDGTLNALLASTGVGKSLVMCHFAAANISMGKNVLYITLEMAEERIAERIDANLFDIDIQNIDGLSQANFTNHIQNVMKKARGKLIIKQYPTASAHTGHFRALIEELKLKKDFIPDVIYVDYLNICASSRMKNAGETYTYIKSVAEELRGLAIEKKVPIWTATQTNRCLAPDTNIIEKTLGNIMIKDIKPGHKILSKNDIYNEVQNVYIQNNDLYEIETESGHTIRCSGNHIFPLETGETGTINDGSISVGKILEVINNCNDHNTDKP